MYKINLKIKTLVAILFSFLIILIVGIMMYLQYKTSHDLVHINTHKVFDRISDNVTHKINTYDLQSKSFIDLLKQIEGLDEKPEISKKHLIAPAMIEYMRASTYAYSTYIGYKNDNFYQIINLDIADTIQNTLGLPLNARWLILKHIKTNNKMIRYEKSFDKDLKELSFEEKSTLYVTTQRPWYKKAIKTKSSIKTNPYLFATLKEYGVTYARVIDKTKGTVLGLDIALRSFSTLLKDKDLVKGSASFIFRQDGSILGQFDEISNKAIKNLKTEYKDIFIKDNKILDLNKHVLIYIKGKEYIKHTTLLKSSFGSKDYLTILSPHDIIMRPHVEKIYETLFITAFMLFLFVLPLIFYFTDLIVKPIVKLEKENLKIAKGNFKEVKEIPSFMIEISSLSSSLVKMSSSLQDLTHNLENKIKIRTEEIEEKNTNIANLLNNAGQGFLYFDKKMRIGKEVSKEALRIFNEDIVGKNILKLLFHTKDQDLIQKNMLYILEQEEEKSEILLTLLKKEVLIHNKFIELDYKILNKDTFMLILTDISDKKELDQQIKEEQQILKMVVEAIKSIEQFKEIKKDYENVILNIDAFKTLDTLSNLRMQIHTYKGLFAQKDMLNIVKELHHFEALIDKSINDEKIATEILDITKEDMQAWLDKDIETLSHILGKDYFSSENRISIKKDRISKIAEDILELKDKVKSYTQNNTLNVNVLKSFQKLLLRVDNLQDRNIFVYINPYKTLVENLSVQLEKPLNALIIKQEQDIYLADTYKGFLNSLVHIFRNSVDHGIETIEEREDKEKELLGTICMDIAIKDNNLLINISDDGRGIDINKIKDLAVQKNIYTKDEIKDLNEQESLLLIFQDSFSTSCEINNISGRGVGLASVLHELNKLKGSLFIKNDAGKGITFMFTLALKQ